MNNIEILENAIKCNKKQFEEIGTHILLQDDEMKAIENLIQENKELKEELEICEADLDEMTISNEHKKKEWVNKLVLNSYIPKSKILNFINNELPDDEICECCSNYDVNGVRLKNELKKLLEEGE